MTPIFLLFTLSTPFVEPMGGKVQAKRLEENARSYRSCKCIYFLLAGAAAIAAVMLYFSSLMAEPKDTAVMQQ